MVVKNKTTFLLKAIISAAFFSMLFSFVSGNELVAILDRIDWFYFILSFLLVPIMLSVSCLKWKMLLNVKNQDVPFFVLIKIYLIGYFFSNLLPSNVGGDVVRSFYTGRLINNQAYAAVSVFVERFSGILFLIVLVIFGPLFVPHLYRSPYVFFPAGIACVLLFAIGWVWMVQDPLAFPDAIMNRIFFGLKRITQRSGVQVLQRIVGTFEQFYRVFFRKLVRFHDELTRAVAIIKKDRTLLAKIIIITIFFYFLTWLNIYVSFLAFRVHPNFLAICALVPIIMFVAHLPVTLLGNLGYFESVFVFYFLLINITPTESLAMGLLLRLKMMSLGAVGFLVYLMYKYHRPGEFDKLEEFAEQNRSDNESAES